METQLITEELHDLVDPDRESCCLHSLGNKCKEWAWKNNFELKSTLNFESGHCQIEHIYKGWQKMFESDSLEGIAEPKVIFKATSYIREQLKNKG